MYGMIMHTTRLSTQRESFRPYPGLCYCCCYHQYFYYHYCYYPPRAPVKYGDLYHADGASSIFGVAGLFVCSLSLSLSLFSLFPLCVHRPSARVTPQQRAQQQQRVREECERSAGGGRGGRGSARGSRGGVFEDGEKPYRRRGEDDLLHQGEALYFIVLVCSWI